MNNRQRLEEFFSYFKTTITLDSKLCNGTTLAALIEGGEVLSGYGCEEGKSHYTNDLLQESGLLTHQSIEIKEQRDQKPPFLYLKLRYPGHMRKEVTKRFDNKPHIREWWELIESMPTAEEDEQ